MIELQRKLLGDKVRNKALIAALKKVVKAGMTVVDVGAGTGYLSFLAEKLGAKECILIEHSEDESTLSKKLAKRNGMKKCRFVAAHSHIAKNIPKADLVISETLGNYALEEHLVENMEDAKKFLKPEGVLMPLSLTQFVVPVVTDRLQKEIDIWNEIEGGFDLQEAREASLHNMYVKTVRTSDLMPGKDSAKAWDTMDFSKKQSSRRRGEVVWNADKATTIHGFCLYWETELAPGITLSTSPSSPLTHWEQIYLPLLTPVEVREDEAIKLILTSDTRHEVGVRVTWQIGSQTMDSMKGFLV